MVAKGYRPVDRDQVFLLPPNLRDWLPAGHRVWFVLDVVDALDLSEFHKGGGSVRCLTNPVDIQVGRDLPEVSGGAVVLPQV